MSVRMSVMRDKSKRVILREVITDVVIVWLPIDLLYLYFAQGWIEPNRIILGVELVLLFLLPIFGIWRVYDFIATYGRKVEEYEIEGESDRNVGNF